MHVYKSIFIEIYQHTHIYIYIYTGIYVIEAGMYYQRIGYVGYRKATRRASSVNLNHSIISINTY